VAPHTGGESFGIVLAEAMAAGTPVLASDLAAFRAVLDEGRLGVLVPSGDARALAAGLAELLDDPARRRRLSEVAAVAVRRYDWSTVADDVLAVYEMAAAAGRRPAAARSSRPPG
jgi:phosphatidyl-myo-inositol alpha-mannosyltransferase